MSNGSKGPATPVEEAGLAVVFPPHLTESYEKADAELMEAYGLSPGVAALMRLTVACWTPGRIRREFERAVLDIKRKTINPPDDGEFDEDCL
jgi:hypothetical protein